MNDYESFVDFFFFTVPCAVLVPIQKPFPLTDGPGIKLDRAEEM